MNQKTVEFEYNGAKHKFKYSPFRNGNRTQDFIVDLEDSKLKGILGDQFMMSFNSENQKMNWPLINLNDVATELKLKGIIAKAIIEMEHLSDKDKFDFAKP